MTYFWVCVRVWVSTCGSKRDSTVSTKRSMDLPRDVLRTRHHAIIEYVLVCFVLFVGVIQAAR